MMRPMTKKAKIQSVKGIRGVRIVLFCNKCKREITSNICPPSNIDVKKCPFSKTHQVLKGYVHVPGSKNARKTFYVKSGNYDEALRIGLNLKQALQTESYAPTVKNPVVVSTMNKKVEQPKLLKYAMAEFMGWLNNENVPSHLQRTRTQDYLDDITRALKYMMRSLKENNLNPDTFRVDQINDETVGLVNDFLLHKKKYSNRSFNKHIGYYTAFMSWLDEHGGSEGIKNYFKKVQHKRLQYNPETITKEEFEQLLQKITPENGLYENLEHVKTKRNFYKSWISDGFRLAIETGRRRPEICAMKWADVHVVEGIPIYIKVEDSKVNNIQNLKDEEKKYVYVPVSKGLHELLIKMGFEDYMQGKNKDAHILAPEIKDKRKERMCNALSRGFTQYYSLLNNEKKLHFGCFRKTYLTGVSIHTSGKAQLVSGHSSDSTVLNKHYIDPKAVASVMAAKGFEVFPKEKELNRKEELKDLRKKKIAPEKSIER
jgi:integrase